MTRGEIFVVRVASVQTRDNLLHCCVLLARGVHPRAPMCPHIDVKFVRMPRDLSVESSIQRWVDRIGWANVEVESAEVTIERSGWRRTSVCLTLALAGERPFTAATSHVDVYVAVADVFREVRKQVIRHVAASAGRSLALLG